MGDVEAAKLRAARSHVVRDVLACFMGWWFLEVSLCIRVLQEVNEDIYFTFTSIMWDRSTFLSHRNTKGRVYAVQAVMQMLE